MIPSTLRPNIRPSKGTWHALNYSKGQITKGIVITIRCTWLRKDGRDYWYCGHVRTGANNGLWGWISWKYAAVA
ncbi:hypothetical protein ACFU99_07705 [Streptomyces sp. NPDC057654]|uniref:hypothetical protein n=1 Tax=Streptomyces sp. NPDC057654 TaxID=3346196 RepID=UPI0036A41038